MLVVPAKRLNWGYGYPGIEYSDVGGLTRGPLVGIGAINTSNLVVYGVGAFAAYWLYKKFLKRS